MEESRLQQRWERLAPARVNLLGEHTDYTCGSVLPMAVRSNALVITHIRTLRTICSGENMSRIGEAEVGKTLKNDGLESGIPPNRSAHVRASVAMRISPILVKIHGPSLQSGLGMMRSRESLNCRT